MLELIVPFTVGVKNLDDPFGKRMDAAISTTVDEAADAGGLCTLDIDPAVADQLPHFFNHQCCLVRRPGSFGFGAKLEGLTLSSLRLTSASIGALYDMAVTGC